MKMCRSCEVFTFLLWPQNENCPVLKIGVLRIENGGIVMSTLLIIPIVAIAAYMIYRHLKQEFSGNGGSCCGCSSREKCQMSASKK
jgi:hypothetical protein